MAGCASSALCEAPLSGRCASRADKPRGGALGGWDRVSEPTAALQQPALFLSWHTQTHHRASRATTGARQPCWPPMPAPHIGPSTFVCTPHSQLGRHTRRGGMLQPNAGQTLSRQLLSRTDPPLLPRRSTDTGRRQVTGHRPHPHLSTSSHTAWPPKAEPRSLHGARASTPRTDPLGRGNIDRAGRR